MIIENITQLAQYESLLPNITKGVAAALNQKEVELGKSYTFDGGYYFFHEGETRPRSEGQFEAHQCYADVQIITSGYEYLEWASVGDLTPATLYNQEKDVQMFDGEAQQLLKVSANQVYICLPNDGHKGGLYVENSNTFSKIVVKIKIV